MPGMSEVRDGMLSGKRVVVLGGSSGIGAEVARQSVLNGAQVTITGRSAARLKEAAASMPTVEVMAFDATDRGSVSEFFSNRTTIDHLVSCVGFTEHGTLLEHDEDRARRIFDVKVWAQLAIVRSGYKSISKGGSIVLTGGTSEDRATFPHASAFSVVANSALGALVKGLAGEVAPVRINVVEPTMTDTPLLGGLSDETRRDLFARFAAKTPIGRVPNALDVAHSYVHLMASELVNGDRIRPDGGPTFCGY